MKFYLHFHSLSLPCYIYKYTSIKIKLELQKNILKFGYGINFKYEGMIAHLFDRFYVVTKFILPTMNDLKLSEIRYNKDCKYLSNMDANDDEQIKTNIKDLITYCAKLTPNMAFYKMQINVYNKLLIIY